MTKHAQIKEFFEIEAVAARPKEHLSGSLWAEKYRVLTSMTSAITGPWQNDVYKVAKGVLDAVTHDNVSSVAWCSGTQNAKTETILNAIGYFIHQQPAPIMLVYPQKSDAKDMSKIRLSDMIESARDNVLLSRVALSEKRADMLNIPFVGGILTLAWATNVNKLASKPVKYLFLDEVDKYQVLKGHGSPLLLASERQKSFQHSKTFMASSPTYPEGAIWQAINNADYLFKFYVTCPRCSERFIFHFGGLLKTEEDTYYKCPSCEALLENKEKNSILSTGEFITESGLGLYDVLESGETRLKLAFHSNSFCSPFISFSDIYKKFEKTKAVADDYKVFVNGWLAEPWDDSETGLEQSADELLKRVETWDKLPSGVLVLTCGVDVQKDRLEALVVGWGGGRESWIVDRQVFYGDPRQLQVWQELDIFLLNTKYPHSKGVDLNIFGTCVDSGYLTDEVYRYTHARRRMRVYAIKGGNRENMPAVSLPQKAGAMKTKLYTLGVHGIKRNIYHFISITEEGQGYIHFKDGVCDRVFFEQLTAEKLVTKSERGKAFEIWVKVRDRNEALDVFCYAYGALMILNPNFDYLAEQLGNI